MASELRHLFYQGVEINSVVYHFALIGVKGDAEFHVEAGEFLRSYSNVGTTNNLKCCPDCEADDNFGDVSDNPVGASVPWDVSDPPPLANVPYSDQYPASLYKRDMFHVIKHGVGREATASILLLLSYLTYFDFPGDSRNLPDRLQRGFKMFKLWCEVEAKTSSMKNFTKANLHFAKKSSFPYMGGKGSDTTWVLMWLDFFLHCCLRDMKGDHKTLLTAMLQLCQGTLNYLGIMHSHDLWLPRSCAQFMVKQGLSSFKGILLLC
ncbi:Uncharacterized protein SCF082_LOCUS21245 [Durusdinium trenchii]